MIRALRFFVFSGLALALASCSGAGGLLGNSGLGGGVSGSSTTCNPGTDVQLANPLPFQTGVNPNIGQITIVANGNNNALAQNYQSLNITLIDSFGNRIPGNALQPADGRSYAHPYDSDFYYQSGFGPLQSGMTYTAELTVVNVSTFNSCAYTLQSFRT
jgi:hypothetical protein